MTDEPEEGKAKKPKPLRCEFCGGWMADARQACPSRAQARKGPVPARCRSFSGEPTPEQAWDGMWPAPEVVSRDALPHEVPSAAASMAKLAQDHGWKVRVTYSRGTVPVAVNRWTPGRVVDAVLVRAQRGAWPSTIGVVASWEDGKTRSAWLLVPGSPPHAINTISARALLKS